MARHSNRNNAISMILPFWVKIMSVWEIDKEMAKHRIVNPLDLTEFDSWVNEATRKDINSIIDRYGDGVFGLKMWKWDVLRGKELRDVGNFEVDLVFRKDRMERVKNLISKYENREIDERKIVDELFDQALYVATWV